jgi:tRNA(Met) C34 N-acetyltransferase TmcA
LIQNGVKERHRSLVILVGDKGKDQVVNLHYMLSKELIKRPSVLWCYEKELGFSSNRQKRMKILKKKLKRGLCTLSSCLMYSCLSLVSRRLLSWRVWLSPVLSSFSFLFVSSRFPFRSFSFHNLEHLPLGIYDSTKEEPFELFLSSTNIRYTFYRETHKVLGQTFGMCVLQDFHALTPNLLARTVETVEGWFKSSLLLLLLLQSHKLYQTLSNWNTTTLSFFFFFFPHSFCL